MTTIPDQPPINHEAAATTLMSTIRELVYASIPGFSLAAKGRRRRIIATASLSDAFLEAVAAACAVHPELGAAGGGLTPSEIRNAIHFSRVYASLAEELRILARGIDDTVAELRNDVGQRALRVYNNADRINRPDDRELLIPHMAAMKRLLNRGRTNGKRASAAKAAALAAATASAPPTTPLAPAVLTSKKEGSSS
jgi:hypothetical protein